MDVQALIYCLVYFSIFVIGLANVRCFRGTHPTHSSTPIIEFVIESVRVRSSLSWSRVRFSSYLLILFFLLCSSDNYSLLLRHLSHPSLLSLASIPRNRTAQFPQRSRNYCRVRAFSNSFSFWKTNHSALARAGLMLQFWILSRGFAVTRKGPTMEEIKSFPGALISWIRRSFSPSVHFLSFFTANLFILSRSDNFVARSLL